MVLFNNGTSSQSSPGLYDEFVFLNRNIDSSDALQMYNSGSPYNYLLFPNAATYLKAWWRFGDTYDFNGDPYTTKDEVGTHPSEFSLGKRIYDRSGNSNDLAMIDLGVGYPNLSLAADTFKELSVQKTIYQEAIVFPNISEITGV